MKILNNEVIQIDVNGLPKDLNIYSATILHSKQECYEVKDKFYNICLEELQCSKYIKIVDYESEFFEFELRSKGIEFLKSGVISKVTLSDKQNTRLSSDDVENWIDEYRKLFKDTRASGKLVDKKSTLKKMLWFISEYPEYNSKSLILRATEKYINENNENNFKYLQRCDYFISKQDTSKIKVSRLAGYCEQIKDDEVSGDTGYADKMI